VLFDQYACALRAPAHDDRNGDHASGQPSVESGIRLGESTGIPLENDRHSPYGHHISSGPHRSGAHWPVNIVAGFFALISVALFVWLIVRVGVYFAK
jgi:hypothetical protein